MTETDWAAAIAHLPHFLGALLTGAVMTVIVTVGGFVGSIALGVLFGAFSTSQMKLLRAVAHLYVEIFRGLPLLTLLFIIFFGLARVGIRLDPISAAIVGFSINGGAYLSEVFRAGIESVHAGQSEAALSIGMTRMTAFRYIILPQAIRVVLPPLANFAIGLLKDTSLASAVAAPEMMFNAGKLVSETFFATEVYLLVATIYLCMSLPLSFVTRMLERRMRQGSAQ
ncbi:amino acid ABC transporter permease [Mesorhizobium sp. B2-5-4]|uniref:amino acid ABC transporter permease n=1 Tax=unclassified Mesorhizobium TaxID=325217 RepID=UPI00112EC9FB|nr:MULTISPECIES: amino acid ABC transporter permease [unclassified Mesorhizobium]TPJ34734.1 amino acid ABC transporter permease [Mesorhizobium sp. B2-6-5]TPJ88164.1 amino acid ABC transporter permease [Mesorhizobium sp. B2-5-13]TPK44720.1 amino acid ABC transporter permease [Mesorhizobium sp. B2-5-4]TPK52359.1 amino acid ABC transporter permease [Mesorhizobium sp. B2-5-5]